MALADAVSESGLIIPCPGMEFVNNINHKLWQEPGSPPNLSLVRSRSRHLSVTWKMPLSSITNKAEEKAYGIKHSKKTTVV